MLSKPVLSPEKQEMLRCAGVLQHRQCRCLSPKLRGMAFCAACFRSLPEDLRRALYRKLGNGFEQAYAAACDFFNQRNQEDKSHG